MGKRNISFLSLPCPIRALLGDTVERCNETSSVLMLMWRWQYWTIVRRVYIPTVPNHAINSLRFTCNILQTWGKWIICLDIVLSTFVTYVGCCIILLLWTSILWITSWGCSLCAGGAVAGMWWDIGWCVAGRCWGIGAAALAKGWVGGGGGGGTGWEDAWEEMEGWKGCTGWGIT